MSKGSGSQQNDAGGRPLRNMGSRSPVAIPGSPQQKEKADECHQSRYISQHSNPLHSLIARTTPGAEGPHGCESVAYMYSGSLSTSIKGLFPCMDTGMSPCFTMRRSAVRVIAVSGSSALSIAAALGSVRILTTYPPPS